MSFSLNILVKDCILISVFQIFCRSSITNVMQNSFDVCIYVEMKYLLKWHVELEKTKETFKK